MDNKKRLTLILNEVFSPIAPIKQKDFFYGRLKQLEKIAEAINEKGQHGILYGERGVGKTSLANIMATSYTNLFPIKITCSRQDNFKTLWENALNKVQFAKTTKGLGFAPQDSKQVVNLGQQLSGIPNPRPTHIENILEQLSNHKLLFIFDEFDNITSEKARASFADLIKTLSDNNTNTTIILIGIADNIESLIGDHQSLERCLKQVKMPRMKEHESEEIITQGMKRLGIKIT